MLLSPFPPAPIPGSESFEVDAGKVLDAIPTLVDELNALQADVSQKQADTDDAAAAAALSQTAAADSATAAALSKTAAADSAAAAAISRTDAENSAGASAVSATASSVSAAASEGSAAKSLAIYGSTAAMQTAVAQAAAQASLAAGYAASASSVVQQDLSGVTAAALHRSPNAVKAMFVYDTSKDSDGGAWTEKCQHTSWYNEPLNGKWLGAQASEAAARAVSGATTGDYFQRTNDGKFYSLNAASGVTEVFRGNKAKFPRLSALVAESTNVTIYDLTEPGRPMWMRFAAGTTAVYGTITSNLAILGGILYLGGASYLSIIDFVKDSAGFQYLSNRYKRSPISKRAFPVNLSNAETISNITAGGQLNAVSMTVLQDAPVDPVTGLQVPTVALASDGISIIQHSGAVRISSHTSIFTDVSINQKLLSAGRADASWYYAANPGSLGAGFALSTEAAEFGRGNTSLLRSAGRTDLVRSSGALITKRKNHEAAASGSINATITNTFNTGHMTGDIRRAYLADVDAGSVSSPSAVADRSYKAGSATVNGTLAKSAVASAAQLVAYSGFSAANYLQEPYVADLDFGTGEWSESAWVRIPTANAAAGIIASRAHLSGAYITLGIDATNKLTATVSDGTTTRTVTSTSAYNTAAWIKVRVSYTTDGSLALMVSGQQVAVTRGAPLLTLNNASAVLTIGNSYALDAPFPGSIALLKFFATVPTPEQSVWMYEQEKQLFRDGAQCCLPDSGAIVDLTYDDATDKWIAVSATNKSEWSGLVRTGVTAVPAGGFSKVAATSGVKLEARTTSSPGVDITIPAYGLREELVKRAESAARLARGLTTFDYVGGFTANTTNGSTSVTSVAGLSYPVSAVGAQVTGAGIPAGTVITAISGTTVYLSKAATATGTAVQISFTDFILPVGYEAKAVLSAGALKQEGATKDHTRLFDGFKEAIRFGAAPGYTAWVQVQAVRSAA